MEEKNYNKVLSGNYSTQNMKALKLILEYGRTNFLDDDFCKELKKDISRGSYVYKTDFYTEIVDIAKKMAEMPMYDLYELMEDKIGILKMTEDHDVNLKEKKKDKNKEAR